MNDARDTTATKTPAAPKAGAPTLTCPRCKVPAHQIWTRVFSGSRANSAGHFYDEARKDMRQTHGINGPMLVGEEWRAAHCQACDQSTLWRGDVNVYPVASTAPAPHPLMDPEVKEIYEEASRVLPISRRAGAALVRAALEKQIKMLDPDAPERTPLDDRIARLSTRVSTSLGELLDVIRHLGNASLHGSGDDELVYMYLSNSDGADDIAELLFDAINDLVDELVARPAATRSVWDKLPDGVRATIERKRNNQRPA